MNMPDASRARPVVLVVDDSPDYLSVVGGLLQDSYLVRVATSGARALELALQQPYPDLLLLDVLMPDMDGYAVLAALRADPRTRAIPAIFFTSLQDERDELAGLAEGAADYIAKPAAPAVLKARIRTQIELKRARDELVQRNLALQQEIAARTAVEQRLHQTIGDLDAFSYSVSHDLRAPLSAIATFACALQAERGSLSAKGQDRLDRIVAASERMNRTIDDILLYSRTDRAAMRVRCVDPAPIVADVVAELGGQAAVTVEPLPLLRADSAMLRQVFANLIGNALKFSGGRAGAQVQIRARCAAGLAELSVRDNGAGFDMAYRDKLFGLFQRLHSESEFPGTGAGLAIVKRLVTRLGGGVSADSVPGGWTTFRFTVPVCLEAGTCPVAVTAG